MERKKKVQQGQCITIDAMFTCVSTLVNIDKWAFAEVLLCIAAMAMQSQYCVTSYHFFQMLQSDHASVMPFQVHSTIVSNGCNFTENAAMSGGGAVIASVGERLIADT